MPMRFRRSMLFRFLACTAVAAFMLVSSPVASANETDHAVVCQYQAFMPWKSQSALMTEGRIQCAPTGPDVSTTTLRIWKHWYGDYIKVAEKVSNNIGTYWFITTNGWCQEPGFGEGYVFHAQIVNSSYHHNWGYTESNSPDVYLECVI